jgi:ASC-1-like (ASCH) protein
MTLHELKTWPEYFQAVARGDKTFEVRKNDRDFRVGDELLLKEYQPSYACLDREYYTGRVLHRYVSYVLHGGNFGIEEGYVILGLQKI